MSAVREPCPNCQLPFYTDRNSECPYCGAPPDDEPTASADDSSTGTPAAADTAPAGSVAREQPPERPRTTCAHCGLPHYADDGNGCPYCDMAGVSPTEHHDEGAATATGPAGAEGTTATPETEPSAGESAGEEGGASSGSGSSGGILASLKRLVGR